MQSSQGRPTNPSTPNQLCQQSTSNSENVQISKKSIETLLARTERIEGALKEFNAAGTSGTLRRSKRPRELSVN